jgi:hypothetical protein
VSTQLLSYAMLEVLIPATLLVAWMVNPASDPGCRLTQRCTRIRHSRHGHGTVCVGDAIGQVNVVSAVVPTPAAGVLTLTFADLMLLTACAAGHSQPCSMIRWWYHPGGGRGLVHDPFVSEAEQADDHPRSVTPAAPPRKSNGIPAPVKLVT